MEGCGIWCLKGSYSLSWTNRWCRDTAEDGHMFPWVRHVVGRYSSSNCSYLRLLILHTLPYLTLSVCPYYPSSGALLRPTSITPFPKLGKQEGKARKTTAARGLVFAFPSPHSVPTYLTIQGGRSTVVVRNK
jgi:hypothetical protein